MHTNDMLTGRSLCLCADLETHFPWLRISVPCARMRTFTQAITTACDRVAFGDTSEVVVQWSICKHTMVGTKISYFQPNFDIEICISPCFSATVLLTGPLKVCHCTAQQAPSTHPYSIVSLPCIPNLDEKSKK